FLIRAAGRSPEEVLSELERRVDNSDADETAEVGEQLIQIAALRLEGILSCASSPHTPSTRPWAHPPPTSRSPSTTEPRSSPRRALTTTDAPPTSGPPTSPRATTGSCSAPAPTSQPVRWTISIPRSPSTSRSRPGRSTITSRCCSARSPTAPTAAAEPPIDTRGSRPPAGSDPQQTAEAGRTPNPAGLADRLVTATAARPSRPCAEEL